MGNMVTVPDGTNMTEVKDFCKQHQIPYAKLNATKWCSVLQKMDIPSGGSLDTARLPLMRAIAKS